jgi:hypothetical protein
VGHDGDRGSVSRQQRSCSGRLSGSQVPGCEESSRR